MPARYIAATKITFPMNPSHTTKVAWRRPNISDIVSVNKNVSGYKSIPADITQLPPTQLPTLISLIAIMLEPKRQVINNMPNPNKAILVRFVMWLLPSNIIFGYYRKDLCFI